MKKICLLVVAIMLLTQCSKDVSKFNIENGKVGLITKDMTVKTIDSVYQNDSVVKQNINKKFLVNNNIEIFEKGGKKLLSLSPSEEKNNNSTIEYIQIFDDRYATPEGATLSSEFKVFRDNYEIKSIERMINNITVFFKNQEFYTTIDMEELPGELKFQRDIPIESIHIPDTAKIKYLWVAWE